MERKSIEENIFKLEIKKDGKFKIKTIILQHSDKCFLSLSDQSKFLEYILNEPDSYHGLN